MSFIKVLLDVVLAIFVNTPIAQINRFENNLPITSNIQTSLAVPQLIRLYGYKPESHVVQTSDGYLLELHRILLDKTGKGHEPGYPLLLLHPLFSASDIWCINGAEKSLAFILANEGYDVWLGNLRGNRYSKANTHYAPNQKQFWDYSYPEMALRDIPAMIDYILDETKNKKLFYIGHSLQGYLPCITLSVLSQYNDKISGIVSLAPLAAIPHTKSILFILLVPLSKALQDVWVAYSSGSFLQPDTITKIFTKYFCPIPISLFGANFCELLVILVIGGGDPRHYNTTSSSALSHAFTAGVSVPLLVDVAKFVYPGVTPEYDYSKIKVPIEAYFGTADTIVVPKDQKKFCHMIPTVKCAADTKGYGHLDFLTASDADEAVYKRVIKTVHDSTS